jgi:hypothetical protein
MAERDSEHGIANVAPVLSFPVITAWDAEMKQRRAFVVMVVSKPNRRYKTNEVFVIFM